MGAPPCAADCARELCIQSSEGSPKETMDVEKNNTLFGSDDEEEDAEEDAADGAAPESAE